MNQIFNFIYVVLGFGERVIEFPRAFTSNCNFFLLKERRAKENA